MAEGEPGIFSHMSDIMFLCQGIGTFLCFGYNLLLTCAVAYYRAYPRTDGERYLPKEGPMAIYWEGDFLNTYTYGPARVLELAKFGS